MEEALTSSNAYQVTKSASATREGLCEKECDTATDSLTPLRTAPSARLMVGRAGNRSGESSKVAPFASAEKFETVPLPIRKDLLQKIRDGLSDPELFEINANLNRCRRMVGIYGKNRGETQITIPISVKYSNVSQAERTIVKTNFIQVTFEIQVGGVVP